MNKFLIFVVRLMLSAFFAVIIMRMFYPGAGIFKIIGLGLFLEAMAYVFEYLKNKRDLEKRSL